MNSVENPFLLTGYISPAYFCDREEETKSLISALRNGRNITLGSPRRIGKTGLIKNAFYYVQEEDKRVACFYIDLMSTKCLADFVRYFGEKVIGRLDTPVQKAENFATRFFRNCRIYWSTDTLSGEPKIGLDFEPTEQQHTLQQMIAFSSIFRSLQSLLDNEIVYGEESGYIVYDRFFGQWLREL